ncbi:unnamed protein product [Cylicocyclus nassatus]|uniref:Uncharacterized protein n=1 Tax=Cylicocyclus nassatus TaxID=53992 RepID=A0AA36HGG0_CYLNA|nr:unnamed protein product [Cylicocyclus nassatus]
MMELPDVVKEKLIELDDENNQLKAEVKRLRASIINKDEILNELEEENIQLLAANQKFSSVDAKCVQLEQTIVSLRVTLEEKTRDSYNLMHEVETLTASLVSARSEIDELRRSSTPPSTEENIVEPSNKEELMRMQKEKDDALFELQEAKKRILELESEREDLIEREEAANAEARDMARHLKETREQMQELETELATFRTNINIVNRGNSMFVEVCSALRNESDKYRADRDKLIEEKADLAVRVAKAEKSVADAQEDIETLKLQLAMMKEREQKKDAAKVSEMINKASSDQGQRLFSILNHNQFTPAASNRPTVPSVIHSVQTPQRYVFSRSSLQRDLESSFNAASDTAERPFSGLKKLRLADNNMNDEEDHSRRASISASELRRIPRKQARRRQSEVFQFMRI